MPCYSDPLADFEPYWGTRHRRVSHPLFRLTSAAGLEPPVVDYGEEPVYRGSIPAPTASRARNPLRSPQAAATAAGRSRFRPVTAGEVKGAGLAEFAKAHRLELAEGGVLPAVGGLLSRDSLVVHETAVGQLRDRVEGTVALLTYTYRSNDTTHHRDLTVAVVRVPESIGFAPYLADATGRSYGIAAGVDAKKIESSGGASVYADRGIDEGWLGELLSPALADWLARSPEGFGWELADGLLVASRQGHLTAELDRLCDDAVHLAAAIRGESLEEVETGAAARSAAKVKEDPQRILLAICCRWSSTTARPRIPPRRCPPLASSSSATRRPTRSVSSSGLPGPSGSTSSAAASSASCSTSPTRSSPFSSSRSW